MEFQIVAQDSSLPCESALQSVNDLFPWERAVCGLEEEKKKRKKATCSCVGEAQGWVKVVNIISFFPFSLGNLLILFWTSN